MLMVFKYKWNLDFNVYQQTYQFALNVHLLNGQSFDIGVMNEWLRTENFNSMRLKVINELKVSRFRNKC